MANNEEWANALLKSRHETWLQWCEPWTACGPEGNEVTAYVVLQANVDDCIGLARRAAQSAGLPIGNDRDHLLDFIKIHWATVSEPPNE